MPLATGRRGVVLLGTAAQRAECYQERPHDPSGVAAFMSAHSKTPCVTHGINVSSGKGVVRGRRLQQLAFTLHRDDAAVGTAATAACRYLVIRPCAGRRWRAKGNPVQHRMSGGTSTGSLREKNTATTNRLTNPDYLDKYPLHHQPTDQPRLPGQVPLVYTRAILLSISLAHPHARPMRGACHVADTRTKSRSVRTPALACLVQGLSSKVLPVCHGPRGRWCPSPGQA